MIICCGSKRYSNINLSKIVDSFSIIVRHNMLINNTVYGEKESTFQVLNSHLYSHYVNNSSKEQWENRYLRFGIQKEKIEEFYHYINENKKTKILFYQNNNGSTLNRILHQTKCKPRLNKMPRCGLSYVAHSIEKGHKPFLIGYSLSENTLLSHSLNTKEKLNTNCHNPHQEIEIIKCLHNKGKLDATFCCIEDKAELTLNDTIEHTEEALEILRRTL